jgi:membrane complex biogenesis BtpA family protein
MVHLAPLPGCARPGVHVNHSAGGGRGEDAGEGRFDAVIVENFGDALRGGLRAKRETIAAISIVVDHVVRSCGVPVGVNVLRNDGLAGLAAAAAAGAAFIRVNVLSGTYATDQGLITGRATSWRGTVRLAPGVRIAADVHVKHAVPINRTSPWPPRTRATAA